MTGKFKIKKGDQVIVITGRDKGKKGEVLEVLRSVSRIRVQGINMVKRHRRATQNDAGGIISMEAPLHISNVAHVDPESGAATRVGFEVKNGVKVRVANGQKKLKLSEKWKSFDENAFRRTLCDGGSPTPLISICK